VVKRQQSRARTLAADISGCDTLAATARRHGVAKPGDLGQLHIGELPDRFRTVVSGLAVGQASPPLRTPDGLHVLVICSRTEPKAAQLGRDTIIDRIGRRRLTMMSRRYLRDLRRDAVVEYR
jgi:peptidyl-prolyl cis-trans isomerase SurA